MVGKRSWERYYVLLYGKAIRIYRNGNCAIMLSEGKHNNTSSINIQRTPIVKQRCKHIASNLFGTAIFLKTCGSLRKGVKAEATQAVVAAENKISESELNTQN